MSKFDSRMRLSNDYTGRTTDIKIKGARQNNLKNIDVEFPLGKLIVVTGVSGSGKSSLAFETLYAEGQRRYVETFSPYMRQFLSRMDKPDVEEIKGIPPAIAIDQTNPVRTSRSTVGTMTELNDHLKLLFARVADLYCHQCGEIIRYENAEQITEKLFSYCKKQQQLIITFPVGVPASKSKQEIKMTLARHGYTRIYSETTNEIEVVQDRVKITFGERERIIEDFEKALQYDKGLTTVYCLDKDRNITEIFKFSKGLTCPKCNIKYRDPVANLFSFNSPIGACKICRGFGRVIDVDFNLVIPDRSKSILQGAIRPWQSKSYSKWQRELVEYCKQKGVSCDIPWENLPLNHQEWILEGEGDIESGLWYGVRGFFSWLEGRSYRMHIRVLLSRYRAYKKCDECGGARLKPEALWWKIGANPTHSFSDIVALSLQEAEKFFREFQLSGTRDKATQALMLDIRSRLKYLVDVGLGYLTLDRQSRTLSGGEVQRINLTTCLGTSLSGVLFVLDEPSIGLHASDIKRLLKILYRLRDTGNTIVVVEHDSEIIRAADKIIDLGIGAGAHGGKIIFSGSYEDLLNVNNSVTGAYLSGIKKLVDFKLIKPSNSGAGLGEDGKAKVSKDNLLEIIGATHNNLKNINISIPKQKLVSITGVSGSGKSTLINDVLYKGFRRLRGVSGDLPGLYKKLDNIEEFTDIILVDQSAIGKSARSNPVSYMKSFTSIRKIFANEFLSKEREYTMSTFSFNSGNGRCSSCLGSGFEHVEMQFLSDVYLRCPDCDGSRYLKEVLDVKISVGSSKPYQTLSIADVLELTVTEGIKLFSKFPDIVAGLEPLHEVGLDYLRLGQPVPTLSGGEAQRLKLASYLKTLSKYKNPAKSKQQRYLFLLDEPTTGLHFADIALLLGSLRKLTDAGNSVVIVEHNLDVIAASDYIIDLGPGGGDAGGEVVATGTPGEIMAYTDSITGKALKRHVYHSSYKRKKIFVSDKKIKLESSNNDSILVKRASQNNLQNIDLKIPKNKFTVITGVSGSGKSTVAFDILFSEGQRRYLNSLNVFARQFVRPPSKPDVDGVFGIPPTVAIQQRTSRGGDKSTVGTMTDIHQFIRLLFVKFGVQYCPKCQVPITAQSLESILNKIMRDYIGEDIMVVSPLVTNRKGYYTELAEWALGRGYKRLRVDGDMVDTQSWPRLDRFREHNIELPVGSVKVNCKSRSEISRLLQTALKISNGNVRACVLDQRDSYKDTATGVEPIKSKDSLEVNERLYSIKRSCPTCSQGFVDLDPRQFSYNSKHGWCHSCTGRGYTVVKEQEIKNGNDEDIEFAVCQTCFGKRLNKESLMVKLNSDLSDELNSKTIDQISSLSVSQFLMILNKISLSGRGKIIAKPIFEELRNRVEFLESVGLGYLSFDRGAPTLSGGEAQRIRLASQLGSNLRGVCYILDEPTIGLHPSDNNKLITTLRDLRDKGNTVIVVEHDEETIRQAEYLIDLGPGGGENGGAVVVAGDLKEVILNKVSATGRLLAAPSRHRFKHKDLNLPLEKIIIRNAFLHNLKNIDFEIPLNKLVAITGVSGSGKSTFVRNVLRKNIDLCIRNSRKYNFKGKAKKQENLLGCSKIIGVDKVHRILEVDQTPVGKTPRSCPATYIGIWNAIRELFASLPEARLRGYQASRFSFNVKDGQCVTCSGQGVEKIEMNFLPDVVVVCEVCQGARFTEETREVKFRGYSIADVLRLSVDQAIKVFALQPKICNPLKLLSKVGLHYLQLGQQSPTLSGGEAQRMKLVAELSKANTRVGRAVHTLYILDEPTVGLHMADVNRLIRVLHELVKAGNSLVVIEHNLDVIAESDFVIDLGPGGGSEGGQIVACGTPEEIIKANPISLTASILKNFFKERVA